MIINFQNTEYNFKKLVDKIKTAELSMIILIYIAVCILKLI